MGDKQLRSKLIRLAHENPELRPDLLPLIQKQAANTFENAMQPCVDRFGTQVMRHVELMMRQDAARSRNPSRWSIGGAETASVSFTKDGQDGWVGVFFFAGPKKGIEVAFNLGGRDWRKTIPLNMMRSDKEIAEDAYYSIPQKLRP